MIRFLLVFMLLLPVLMVLELTAPAQQWFVLPWTSLLTRITAFLLSAFDANAMSYGKILLDTRSGIGVSVEAGCNGVEACIILLAAMLAYPAPWKLKLLGILGGSVAVQAVNVLRVISLFYLARWDKDFFEFAHLYLWQALIMLDVLIVWLVWIRIVAQRTLHPLPHPWLPGPETMEKHFSIIGGFFLRTVLLLIPMLALWYWAREWVVAPPAWLAGKALQFQFPSWVLGIEREGLHHVLLTNLRVVTPNRQIGELTPEIRALSYCYGSALLPALLLGGQARKLWWKLPTGLALLIPFQAWGIAFAWLLQVAVQAGPQVASEAGFSVMGMNLVAAGYQFGYLIFPALAPVLVWLALDRRLMATVLLEGSLSGKH